MDGFLVYKTSNLNYFVGIFSKISNTNFQYFCAEEMLARSSGECAPWIVGPKEIMSMLG